MLFGGRQPLKFSFCLKHIKRANQMVKCRMRIGHLDLKFKIHIALHKTN